MKSFTFWGAMMLFCFSLSAQELSIIDLPQNVSLHFISPEPIRYVDISVKSISGDLPLSNVLRIKRNPDSASHADAIVTIAGQSFLAQYRVRYVPMLPGHQYQTQIEVVPEHMKPLESGPGLTKLQLEKLAAGMLFKKQNNHISHAKAFGIEANINGLATFGDYIFIDVSYRNKTNLRYDTDEIRFKIEDQKVTKASTVQAIEIKPELALFKNPAFRRNLRNVYVFKKFSFPGHKILKIELNEKQITGRLVEMRLKYKDLLEADGL